MERPARLALAALFVFEHHHLRARVLRAREVHSRSLEHLFPRVFAIVDEAATFELDRMRAPVPSSSRGAPRRRRRVRRVRDPGRLRRRREARGRRPGRVPQRRARGGQFSSFFPARLARRRRLGRGRVRLRRRRRVRLDRRVRARVRDPGRGLPLALARGRLLSVAQPEELRRGREIFRADGRLRRVRRVRGQPDALRVGRDSPRGRRRDRAGVLRGFVSRHDRDRESRECVASASAPRPCARANLFSRVEFTVGDKSPPLRSESPNKRPQKITQKKTLFFN